MISFADVRDAKRKERRKARMATKEILLLARMRAYRTDQDGFYSRSVLRSPGLLKESKMEREKYLYSDPELMAGLPLAKLEAVDG